MFVEIHSDTGKKLPFLLYTVGENDHQKPVDHPEGASFSEFLWVIGGSGTLEVGNTTIPFLPGNGVFLRPGTPHRYEGSADFHTAWVTFLGADGLLDFLHIPPHLTFSVSEAFSAGFADLSRQAQSFDSTTITRSAVGYAFVAEWLDRFCRPEEELLFSIRLYLENHFAEPLTLDTVADAVGVKKFALCRYMKRTVGHGVTEELTTIRIRKAKRFLRTDTAPIAKIAAASGFDSPSYFTAVFHKLTGKTPDEYRKKR